MSPHKSTAVLFKHAGISRCTSQLLSLFDQLQVMSQSEPLEVLFDCVLIGCRLSGRAASEGFV